MIIIVGVPSMKEIVVTIDNRVGALAQVCEKLGGAGINIESISAYGDGQKGIIRFVTGDEVSALSLLSKSGARASVSDVVVVKANDQPGELGKITRRLAQHMVNIESIYLLTKQKGIVEFAIKCDNPAKAQEAMKK